MSYTFFAKFTILIIEPDGQKEVNMKKIFMTIKGMISKSKEPSEYIKFYNAHMGDVDLEH